MPSSRRLLPTILHHEKSGQARCWVGDKYHYLGPYGSPESLQEYAILVSDLQAGREPRPRKEVETVDKGPSVGELCLQFKAHAEHHYVKDGKQTSEVHVVYSVIRPLRELFGYTPAEEFGPLALKTVRTRMIELGWARTTINAAVGRIRRIFKFAVENEQIDVTVYQRLQAVAPLLKGRTTAPEKPKRRPVAQEHIDAVKRLVQPIQRDLIDLQLFAGARPGELLKLTPNQIDQSAEIWRSELSSHKTDHHDHERTLYFGPNAQAILARYLDGVEPDALIFQITRAAYCRAVTRACKKAGIPRWTPHWLRHTFCTRVRQQHGLESSQAMAGHSNADTTRIYSDRMDELAMQTAAAVG